MQRCSVMNPIIRRICKLIRGRKSSAEGMTELGFEWWTGVRHVGGRRIAQVGNSKFKEHPREQGTLREQGRVHYATTHCLPSGPLVSHFPGSEGRESACSAGDSGSVPGSGRSPGEGNGNPPQYSCLEIPTEEPGRLQSIGIAESDMTEWLHFHFHLGGTGWVGFHGISLTDLGDRTCLW